MASFFAFLMIFSLLLVAYARKDMGEYWKDQYMPEEVVASKAIKKKPDCHTSETFELKKQKNFDAFLKGDRSFVGDFKPRQDATIDHNEALLKGDKSFVGDFKLRQDATIYHNCALLKEDQSFVGDFKPRQDAIDALLKEDKSFISDFKMK